jgi:hypothetical protein
MLYCILSFLKFDDEMDHPLEVKNGNKTKTIIPCMSGGTQNT